MANRILSTSAGTNQEAFAPLDWLLFLSIGSIWGSSFLLMDIGLEALHPGAITLIRVALGALVLAAVPRARRPIDRSDWPRIAALAVLWVGIPFSLFPVAQQWVDSAVAGMINGAMPIFATFFATLMLRRLPRGAQAVGLAIGFTGVVLMSVASGADGGSQAGGVAILLGATVCYGLSVNIVAPLTQRYGSLQVMVRILALGTVLTAPFGIVGLAGSSFAWGPVLAVAAAGVVGTGLAFVIMGILVGRVGSTRGSFTTYLIPVVALFLGVVFRGDVVSWFAVLGVALVIAGALLASRREAVRTAR